jgi:hypothetical protein
MSHQEFIYKFLKGLNLILNKRRFSLAIIESTHDDHIQSLGHDFPEEGFSQRLETVFKRMLPTSVALRWETSPILMQKRGHECI